MRNTLITLITASLITLLVSSPVHAAAKSSKEEVIGIGSGALIGAAAGGPVGFFIGSAIGAKLGDNWHKRSEELDTLDTSLMQSRDTVAALESNIDTLSGEIERLQNVARPELVSLMQAGIEMDLLFRTDEAALVDTTGERLAQLASTIGSLPQIRVQLDGFADERGDEAYNFKLSEQRVEFVRQLFIDAGVHPQRINVSAHGESTAQDENMDSYALERRVSVKLFIDDAPAVAANPN
jgi:outer membrane protein OmpA-like peptidoglycan-associated protein